MPITLGVKPSNSRPRNPGPGRVIRKTVLLFTVLTSMAPSNGMERRGCRLKPSSWFTSVRSAQSEGLVAQLGSGTFTRKPVSCCESKAVNRSLRKGDCVVDCKLKSGCVSAGARTGVSSTIATSTTRELRTNEYFSVRVVCIAVENLQGELLRVTKTLDLQESLVNGCDQEFCAGAFLENDGFPYSLFNHKEASSSLSAPL